MKLITKGEIKKDFKPFDLNLRVETAEEARLLWHIFNCLRMSDYFIEDVIYPMANYNCNIAEDITSDEIRKYIEEHVDINKEK